MLLLEILKWSFRWAGWRPCFVQNTVCLFKVPALRPANSVRQMSSEQLKQRHALPVQFLQLTHRHVPLPAQHTPFQSFDEYLCDLVWVHYRRHIE